MKKLVKSHKLSSLNGVKDVSFGKAGIEARAHRDFSKTGKSSGHKEDSSLSDVAARQKRFGYFF
jgi:hypothetical protein